MRRKEEGPVSESNQYGSPFLCTGTYHDVFPKKLWHLLKTCDTGAIKWNDQGNAILINQNRFQDEILESSARNLFKTSNLRSFIRQLNLYGFKKANPLRKKASNTNNSRTRPRGQKTTEIKENKNVVGDNFMVFRHSCFLKSQPQLVSQIRRKIGIRVQTTKPSGRCSQQSPCKSKKVEVTSTGQELSHCSKQLAVGAPAKGKVAYLYRSGALTSTKYPGQRPVPRSLVTDSCTGTALTMPCQPKYHGAMPPVEQGWPAQWPTEDFPVLGFQDVGTSESAQDVLLRGRKIEPNQIMVPSGDGSFGENPCNMAMDVDGFGDNSLCPQQPSWNSPSQLPPVMPTFEYSGNSVPAANLNHAGLNFPAPVSSCVQFSFMPSEPMHSMPASCPPCPPRRPLVVENPLTEREPSHVVRWVADQNGGATFLDDGGRADTHSGPYPGRCPRRAAVQDGYSPAGYPAYFAGNDAFPQGCSAPLDEGTYLRKNRDGFAPELSTTVPGLYPYLPSPTISLPQNVVGAASNTVSVHMGRPLASPIQGLRGHHSQTLPGFSPCSRIPRFDLSNSHNFQFLH